MSCVCGGAKDLLLCASCKTVKYCSKACQAAAWPGHRAECKYIRAVASLPSAHEASARTTGEALEAAQAAEAAAQPPSTMLSAERSWAALAESSARLNLKSLSPLATPGTAVMCVRMSCLQRAEQVLIERSDPIFQRGEPSPVMALCGIPLFLVWSREGLQRLPLTPELDNQAATYFMIPPYDGYGAFAPGEWQWNIGEVTLVRRDFKHLTLLHFHHLWDFFCTMLDKDSGRAEFFSPRGFRQWSHGRGDQSDTDLALHATW